MTKNGVWRLLRKNDVYFFSCWTTPKMNNCQARAVIELVRPEVSLRSDLGTFCTILPCLPEEASTQPQEFLLLLRNRKFDDGNSGLFIAQDHNDEAIMLSLNDNHTFSWTLFNPELDCLEFNIKLGSSENEFELTTLTNSVIEYLVISHIDNGVASLSLSKDPANSLHFRVKDFFFMDNNTAEQAEAEAEDEKLAEQVDSQFEPPSVPENVVIAIFEEGSLGLTLRRRNDGVVYAHEVDSGTQADKNNIQVGDILWAVGSQTIGDNLITKERWTELVKYIQSTPRPLQMLFQRKETVTSLPAPTPQVLQTLASTASSSASNDSRIISPSNKSQSPSISPPLSPQSTSPTHVEDSPDIVSLKRLASRLIFKEKEKQPEQNQKQKISSMVKSKLSGSDRALAHSMEVIVRPGRKIIKHGCVGVPGKMALWNVQTKKFLFLMTDLLLITVGQGEKFLVESCIDLQTCKVNVRVESDLIDPTTTDLKSVFEIIHPTGTSLIICDDFGSQQAWVEAIYEAICDGVDQEERIRVIGWRHQYMLGTMHSAVLSHDIRKVRNLLEACANGEIDPLELETQDDDGYTPLHYSCLLRLTNITRLLHESSADVTIPDSHGLTALHWAALQLDWEALEMLCTHVFHIDILDGKNRSPLYLACVEGRNVKGHTDITSLIKCVTCLLHSGANPNFKDKEGLSCLHFLSASWQYPVVEVILNFGRSSSNKSSLTSPENQLSDVNIRADNGGWTPLHYACSGQPLKRAIGEGQRILQSGDSETIIAGNPDHGTELQPWIQSSDEEEMEQTNQADSISTIRILLEHGAIPNLSDFRGRRPMAILAENLYRFVDSYQACLVTIISHGGRLEDVPEEFKADDAATVIAEGQEFWNQKKTLNGDDLKIRSTFLPSSPPTYSLSFSPLPLTSAPSLSLNEYEGRVSAALLELPTNDHTTRTCLLCTMPLSRFSLSKRPHHCRLCNLDCCDDCSKKRVIINKEPVSPPSFSSLLSPSIALCCAHKMSCKSVKSLRWMLQSC
jgi:hypothetical protein